MRAAILAIVLSLWAPIGSRAFETEEARLFPATGADPREVSIISTTDGAVLAPVIAEFQKSHPGIAVRYTVASSQAVFSAIYDEGLPFDLAISSAMDLQMKLANDGLAAPHLSSQAARIPAWAHWQDRIFAFAQEDVVLLVSREALGSLPLPETRRDLIELLRENPMRFQGRVGTYDPMLSGAGYLFATQDSRQSDSFWRLAEVMGNLSPRLYVSTSDMIDDVKSGRLAIAYNALGSYAAPRLAEDPDVVVVALQDYTLTLLRTAIVPTTAKDPALGGIFLDFLLSADGQAAMLSKAGLPPIDEAALAARPYLRPMRLDPGLLVFLDSIKRKGFLDEWASALTRN